MRWSGCTQVPSRTGLYLVLLRFAILLERYTHPTWVVPISRMEGLRLFLIQQIKLNRVLKLVHRVRLRSPELRQLERCLG